ncbi:MAG: hypothetical protein V4793_16185 [Paraburkholderia tropica]|uniref:hypothetical protein n=1 Tax=Burkholderia gladioli TaxID=28095 RepID=UPI00163ED52F|nr:hypothetical protein [Burkholderia gladioli]
MNEAIGGYFELELPPARGEFHHDVRRFQSARTAFLAALQASRPPAVWVPWFLCDAMLEPFAMTGIPVRRYAIDDRFFPADAAPAPGEWLLYVNYFGLCDRQVEETLKRFGRDRVVVDNSQAFFSPHRDSMATLYSPRKFFGVPDGGYLATRLPMSDPPPKDTASATRCLHLLRRVDASPEPAYADFTAAEASLHGLAPCTMSALTQRLLSTIDYDGLRARRAGNFAWLHGELGRYNRFQFTAAIDVAPLCYPLQLDAARAISLRSALREARIYTPIYWPNVRDDASAPAFERSLPDTLVPLPCDHRVTHQQRRFMAQAIIERLA